MDKTTQKLITFLHESRDEELLKSIDRIKAEATSEVLPALLERWRDTHNDEVHQTIYHLLIDIKDEKSVPHFFNALEDESFTDLRAELTGVLWQSGLDVSGYLTELIQLATLGDYMTAVEVSTVVENLEGHWSEEEIGDAIYQIQEAIDVSENEDLINLLENIKELLNQLYAG